MEPYCSTSQDFFVADGEGLPRSVVEQEAKFPEEILDLYSLQVCSLVMRIVCQLNG